LNVSEAYSGLPNNLPYDKKYIEPVKTEKEILQIVNVVYFGGDCQKALKLLQQHCQTTQECTKQRVAKSQCSKI
jgi:hypothetical protein